MAFSASFLDSVVILSDVREKVLEKLLVYNQLFPQPHLGHLKQCEKLAFSSLQNMYCDLEISQGWSNDPTTQSGIGEQEGDREDVLSPLRPARKLGKLVWRVAWRNLRVHLQLMHCRCTKSLACHGMPVFC